jgi:hypothetical protein
MPRGPKGDKRQRAGGVCLLSVWRILGKAIWNSLEGLEERRGRGDPNLRKRIEQLEATISPETVPILVWAMIGLRRAAEA